MPGALQAAVAPDPYSNPAVVAPYGALGPASSPYAEDQAKYADELRGAGSPLQQFQALQAARDQAAQQKAAAIQNAMAILQAGRAAQTTSLPMLAAGAAMLQPTRSGGFAESLANGLGAAGPVIAQQRMRDEAENAAMGNLGVQAAGVPLETAQADIGDFFRRMQLAEQAASSAALTGTRLGTAQIAAQSRTDAAQIRAQAQENSATIRTNRNNYQYLGPSKDDPTIGLFLNKSTGETTTGPAALGTGRGQQVSATQWRYDTYIANHQNDPGKTPDQVKREAEQFAAGHKTMSPEEINKYALYLANKDLANEYPKPKDEQAYLTRKQKFYVDNIRANPDQASAAPAGGTAPPGGASSPQAGRATQWTAQSPYHIKATTLEEAQRELGALPPGSVYVNPSDGKLYRTK